MQDKELYTIMGWNGTAVMREKKLKDVLDELLNDFEHSSGDWPYMIFKNGKVIMDKLDTEFIYQYGKARRAAWQKAADEVEAFIQEAFPALKGPVDEE